MEGTHLVIGNNGLIGATLYQRLNQKGESVILLVDDENKVVDIAVPPQ